MECQMGYDTADLWKQIGSIHTDLVNSGVSVSFPVYLKHLSDALLVRSIEISLCPEVPTLCAGDDVCVGKFRLSGDLDAFRAAFKADKVDS